MPKPRELAFSLLAAGISALGSGCAQSGIFQPNRANSLAASLSHSEAEVGQLRREVDQARLESDHLEDELNQERAARKKLAQQLKGDDQRKVANGGFPDDFFDPGGKAETRPAAQSNGRKPPSIQIKGPDEHPFGEERPLDDNATSSVFAPISSNALARQDRRTTTDPWLPVSANAARGTWEDQK
jgi:hypothetical protein